MLAVRRENETSLHHCCILTLSLRSLLGSLVSYPCFFLAISLNRSERDSGVSGSTNERKERGVVNSGMIAIGCFHSTSNLLGHLCPCQHTRSSFDRRSLQGGRSPVPSRVPSSDSRCRKTSTRSASKSLKALSG